MGVSVGLSAAAVGFPRFSFAMGSRKRSLFTPENPPRVFHFFDPLEKRKRGKPKARPKMPQEAPRRTLRGPKRVPGGSNRLPREL